MKPWQVIEEALLRRRPARGPKWLADQLGESIQTVSNWKARGVPVKRFRDIGAVLGLSVDQIEGVDPPPWEAAEEIGFRQDVFEVATEINALPATQRAWVIKVAREAIELAQQTLGESRTKAQQRENVDASASSDRMIRKR